MPLKVAPFESWTYEDAVREMRAVAIPEYGIKKAYAVDRDHWQDGDEWVGPGDPATNEAIETQFSPEDAIGEVLNNISNAFEEPQLGAVPLEPLGKDEKMPEELEKKIEELKNLLTEWWDCNKMQTFVQERQRVGAWAGFAALRLWTPWRYVTVENGVMGILSTNDLLEAAKYLYVQNPLPEAVRIITDPATQDKCAVFLDEEVEWITNPGTQEKEKKTYKRAELQFLDPNRITNKDAKTIIRIVYSGKEKRDLRAEQELQGFLPTVEMELPVLVTNPVIRTQRQLNLLCTIITRIAETAAFRERYITNAKPQGLRTKWTDGDTIPDGAFVETDNEGQTWLVVPTARTLGAHTTTEIVGLDKKDDTGAALSHESPGVIFADPVDPKPYLEAGDATRRRALRMCAQGHLGGISNAEASGIAYEQARAVFEKDLNRRRVPEEAALRDFLTTVVIYAENITNKQGYFTEVLRITVDQHVNPGPRSPDLVRLDIEAHDAALLSTDTAMTRLQVEDLQAEKIRIRGQAQHIIEVLEKAAPLFEKFTPESMKGLLVELGVPESVISTLVPNPQPTVVPPAQGN